MSDNDNSKALVPSHPSTALAQLATPEELRRAQEILSSATARSTADTYQSAWRQFTKWCAARNPPIDLRGPISPELLVIYITQRAGQGKGYLSVKTLRVHLAAIAAAHARAFPTLPSPTAAPAVTLALDGAARAFGQPANKKAPATAAEVLRLLGATRAAAYADGDDYTGARDRALFLLAFATGMRRSELVSVRLEWLTPAKTGFLITIPRSKGDQRGEGQKVALVRNVEERLLCPVGALEDWLRVRYGNGSFLFPAEGSRSTTGHLSADFFVKQLKRAAVIAGWSEEEVSKFAGHSFRRGLATQLHLDGAHVDDIQPLLRHKDRRTTEGYIADEVKANNQKLARLGRGKGEG